jgi:hypothetical protein
MHGLASWWGWWGGLHCVTLDTRMLAPGLMCVSGCVLGGGCWDFKHRTLSFSFPLSPPVFRHRRFVWKQFQFMVFRGRVRHLLEACFRAWRASLSGIPAPVRIAAPPLGLPNYLKLLRDFEAGKLLENPWDERVMRNLLLNPPPSQRVLDARAAAAAAAEAASPVASPGARLGTSSRGSPASRGGAGVGAGGVASRTGTAQSPVRAAGVGAGGFGSRTGTAQSPVRSPLGTTRPRGSPSPGGGSHTPSAWRSVRDLMNTPMNQRRASMQMATSHGVEDNLASRGVDTPLHVAADSGDVAAVRRLLHEGADPNVRNDDMKVGVGCAYVGVGGDRGRVTCGLGYQGDGDWVARGVVCTPCAPECVEGFFCSCVAW